MLQTKPASRTIQRDPRFQVRQKDKNRIFINEGHVQHNDRIQIRATSSFQHKEVYPHFFNGSAGYWQKRLTIQSVQQYTDNQIKLIKVLDSVARYL